LSRNVKVLARYNELQEQAASKKKATVQERQEILTEIVRAKPEDYLILSEDGRDLVVNPKAMKSMAVSYLRTEQIALGKMPVRLTRVGMADKNKAIDLLNKMDRIYNDTPQQGNPTTNIMNIIVIDGETKDIISQVKERTGKLLEANRP